MVKLRLSFAFFLALLAACGSDTVGAPMASQDAAADGGLTIDAGSDLLARLDASFGRDAMALDSSQADVAAADAGRHAGVHIVVKNATAGPLYLPSAGAEVGPALTLAVAGQPLRFEAGCSDCVCGHCADCAACGRAISTCGASSPTVARCTSGLGASGSSPNQAVAQTAPASRPARLRPKRSSSA